jgi:hypothetical protein
MIYGMADKDISVEDKTAEEKKVVLSSDAFAVCDFIEQLIKQVWKLNK